MNLLQSPADGSIWQSKPRVQKDGYPDWTSIKIDQLKNGLGALSILKKEDNKVFISKKYPVDSSYFNDDVTEIDTSINKSITLKTLKTINGNLINTLVSGYAPGETKNTFLYNTLSTDVKKSHFVEQDVGSYIPASPFKGDKIKDISGTSSTEIIHELLNEVSKLTASDAQGGDVFGSSVALSGDGLIAMVGAIYEDTAASNAGKVYTYKRADIDSEWTEVSQLTASDAQGSDVFGSSVALSSDGLIAMVGAMYEDTAVSDAGKVYTYKRADIDSEWTEVSKLTASDAQGSDVFGSSVALSGDGLIAMVGAMYEDTAAGDAGKVYTYKRANIDSEWTEVSQLTASDSQWSDVFGSSVALSSDGLIAMVGAMYEDTAANNAGKVYTY